MIEGVTIKKITTNSDDRGYFREILRNSDNLIRDIRQISVSKTKPGVIKAFHWHKDQDDIFCLLQGKVQVVLHDGRKTSTTYKKTEVIILGENHGAKALFIPRGVLHGYKTIGKEDAEMLYIMNNEYDAKNPDEQRVAHNDPEIGFDWETDSITERDYFEIDECRVCGNKDLKEYIDLGDMPLANAFVCKEGVKNEKFFPLKVLFCPNCALSQLSIVVDPTIIFEKDYVYRSSMSKHFIKHCDELAEELNKSGLLKNNEIIMDIASNDGALLEQFKKKGNRVLGIEPAKNLAKIASDNNIETVNQFWTHETAKRIKESYGKVKVVTAFNVFAHVHNLHSFVKGIKEVLDDEGYFIIESPYLGDLIKKNQFDTIYHEHLSYLLLKPVKQLMERHGLKIVKVTKQDIHGGSIRFYIRHQRSNFEVDKSVEEMFSDESTLGLHSFEFYKNFGEKAAFIKNELVKKLNELRKEGMIIAGYGASAKGNILLNYAKIDSQLVNYIFDNTPEKQNKLTPGTNIQVVHENELKDRNPDYVLLLAWNFVNEIVEKSSDYLNKGGKFIVPVPELAIITKENGK